MVKESGTSFWLASVGHQMKLDSTNGTLGLGHLPTDLAHITILISCFWRLEMYVDLCEIPTQTWIGTSEILCLFELFCKVVQLNLLCKWPPYFPPCSTFALISCVLVLLCSRSHVGVTCIFAMGWVYLITWLESISQNVKKSTMLSSFHVW